MTRYMVLDDEGSITFDKPNGRNVEYINDVFARTMAGNRYLDPSKHARPIKHDHTVDFAWKVDGKSYIQLHAPEDHYIMVISIKTRFGKQHFYVASGENHRLENITYTDGKSIAYSTYVPYVIQEINKHLPKYDGISFEKDVRYMFAGKKVNRKSIICTGSRLMPITIFITTIVPKTKETTDMPHKDKETGNVRFMTFTKYGERLYRDKHDIDKNLKTEHERHVAYAQKKQLHEQLIAEPDLFDDYLFDEETGITTVAFKLNDDEFVALVTAGDACLVRRSDDPQVLIEEFKHALFTNYGELGKRTSIAHANELVHDLEDMVYDKSRANEPYQIKASQSDRLAFIVSNNVK